MISKSDFAPEEWQLLFTAAPMTGLAITAASPSGPFGVLKEMFSVGLAMGEAVSKPSPNPLVQAIADDLKARATKPEKPKGVKNVEEARALALERLRQVKELLARKAPPDVADGFKRWLLEVAHRVAEASNEGGFLGFGGEKVSDAERAALRDIAAALGVDAPQK
jgi:hypothetical protein